MKLDLFSTRAREARLAKAIGPAGGQSFALLAILAIAVGVWLVFFSNGFVKLGWLAFALAALLACLSLWYFRRLAKLPANLNSDSLDQSLSAEALALLPKNKQLTPRLVWQSLNKSWQLIFITNHFLLSPDSVNNLISDHPDDLAPVWNKARDYANSNQTKAIELGFVAAALLATSPSVGTLFQKMKLRPEDIDEVAGWLARGVKTMHREKQSFGGVGRDWAYGYTPLLDRYGSNISQAIVHSGAHFGHLTSSQGVKAIEAAFHNQASAVAIIGDPGAGKTSQVYALAQLMIEGRSVPSLSYHQIIGLDASRIISSARGQGQLEYIVSSLANEASHAGHIVLFFDDFELFTQNGAGSFDATRILQPLLESHRVPIIVALSPSDFQRLRSANPTFASLLSPVVLTEPSQADTMKIVEDSANGLEHRRGVVIAYEAIRAAYDLSGRYDQDRVYPGKAINLLDQAVANSVNGKIVTAASVEQAVEQATGVKVSGATQTEASELINLEDKIHERMINQSRAVQVVSAALRRARAGVASTNRPIGSFLFLGPTGVGKTELAKSIAATYFGNEASMIRLDMSEYQQDSDVSRLLASGANEASSLILSIRQQPFSVVLLDEIEKAHPNILNLLLQLLDEGQLTDSSGKPASFRDAIIIATSNAGADTIRQKIEQGQELESFEKDFTDQLINSGQFKPELLNRFDEIVLFRPLKPEELNQVVKLMLAEVNHNLAKQNISVELTDAAITKIVEEGNDPRLGARPMRRAIQRLVEDNVANKILKGEVQPGDKITLDISDLN